MAMQDFEKRLYEALLVAYGKVLSKYNAFAQGSILRDVGKEILDYMHKHGFEFEETGTVEDLSNLTRLFVENGFTERLEITPADKGQNYTWHNLYGIDAYKELHEISDNPFLACPLNLCLFYLTEKQGKTMLLHRKTFDLQTNTVEAQYELTDRQAPSGQGLDPLVIENARLYELAQERADLLAKALNEIRMLKGIVPICRRCKKVRDDQGYWHQVEAYIEQHTDIGFLEGYCPECREEQIQQTAASYNLLDAIPSPTAIGPSEREIPLQQDGTSRGQIEDGCLLDVGGEYPTQEPEDAAFLSAPSQARPCDGL
jgi:hypothetical protein